MWKIFTEQGLLTARGIWYTHENNHIYSTLFKTQERESDRSSKEIEQKESQKHTKKQQQGHVTLSTELQSTALA